MPRRRRRRSRTSTPPRCVDCEGMIEPWGVCGMRFFAACPMYRPPDTSLPRSASHRSRRSCRPPWMAAPRCVACFLNASRGRRAAGTRRAAGVAARREGCGVSSSLLFPSLSHSFPCVAMPSPWGGRRVPLCGPSLGFADISNEHLATQVERQQIDLEHLGKNFTTEVPSFHQALFLCSFVDADGRWPRRTQCFPISATALHAAMLRLHHCR